MKSIFRAVVPVVLGAAAAFAVAQAPANAGTLLTVHVQAQNRILTTTQGVWVGETLHAGLNGEAVTVVAKSGNVAWVSPFLPRHDVGKVIVLSTS